MFKNQPKGLFPLALANTGERFGYYTMLAIFTLFLQAKFGYSSAVTSNIFAGFLAFVYFLPILGGILADKIGYGKTVTAGIVIMFAGYVALAIPTGANGVGEAAMFGALFLIALGTGLFKGNLQVLVGNLYDDPKYSDKRDTAFSLFYMAINIGALFAPTAATKVTEIFMGKSGFTYKGDVPALCHDYINNVTAGTEMAADKLDALTTFAQAQTAEFTGDLMGFAQNYLDTLSTSYHYGFGVACISLIISMLIYKAFKFTYKHADVNSKQAAANNEAVVELTPEQTKSRITALGLVMAVVIFFWMAFHQNGLTMTFFARDYTARTADGILGMSFNVWNLVLLLILIYGAFSVFQSKGKGKIGPCVAILASIAGLAYNYLSLDPNSSVAVLPQMFQQFNPFFVVALTPVSLAVFGALAQKGKEPSAPRKIGIGMFIAALGFTVLAFFSFGLPKPAVDGATVVADNMLVSPTALIYTYLVLTFAELFLSPMGISFVSKVAPPKYKGLMMGLWFGATAVGNYLVSIIGMLWGKMDLWLLWTILIVLCLISAFFIFAIMKKLENATK